MKLVQEPTVETRTWAFDSRRWSGYRPRPDDIVIATYAKSGTTWMQRIVGMLVFASAEPKPVLELSIWPDRRGRPIDEVFAAMEAQTHRRFLKAHLPYASLPIYDEVRYVHVARDGRDACMRRPRCFAEGSAGFFFKGTNNRWKGVFREEDLALYDAAMARLPPACAQWLAEGRLGQEGH